MKALEVEVSRVGSEKLVVWTSRNCGENMGPEDKR